MAIDSLAELRPYRITAYTEWETMDVEALAAADEHAIAKARRYGSLQHVGRNFPALIITDVVCEFEGSRLVGTWEYRVRGRKPGLVWHSGEWRDRPDTSDRKALRQLGIELSQQD